MSSNALRHIADSWPLAVAGVAAVLAMSPLLSAWTAALTSGSTTGWWRWRPTTVRRWAEATGIGIVLVIAAVPNRPWPAWALLAAGGAVLALVDARTHRLPARLVDPLATAIAIVLVGAAVIEEEPGRLFRAALAAAAVATIWLAILLAAPNAIGLGDVRLLVVAGGLLGWTSWPSVLVGELIAFLVGAAVITTRAIRPDRQVRLRTPVAMGPAILLGTLASAWIFQ